MKRKSIFLRKKYKIARRLKLNNSTKLDTKDEMVESLEKRILNVKKRIEHLAEILEHLKNIYENNRELYDDKFLEFVGYYVIRNWPDKDFPFFSEKAKNELGIDNYKIGLIGLTRRELSKKIGDKMKKLTYEHWTPLSFFRDLFDKEEKLTKKDFYEILIDCYRVVYITKEEDLILNARYKSSRPINAYEELNIKIDEIELWKKFDN